MSFRGPADPKTRIVRGLWDSGPLESEVRLR